MSDESIEGLARRLAESVPEGLRSARGDLESNFRAVLKSGIGKLDLVTREEFEVQQAVLGRTREKLEALEARLAAMESTASPPARQKASGGKAAKKKVTKKKAAGKAAKKVAKKAGTKAGARKKT